MGLMNILCKMGRITPFEDMCGFGISEMVSMDTPSARYEMNEYFQTIQRENRVVSLPGQVSGMRLNQSPGDSKSCLPY